MVDSRTVCPGDESRTGLVQPAAMRRIVWGLAPIVLLTACPSTPPPPRPSPQAAPPKADLVLSGGIVHTQDPQQPAATAVAIRAGRIVAVGSDAQVTPWVGAETRHIDLAGRVALPGLVDAHMHLTGLGKRALSIDLVGTKTLAEVKAKVRSAAARAPAGQWIVGRGWDQNDWSDHRGFPKAKSLDEVAPDHPVALTRVDGHALWVNTAAMMRARITKKTRPKSGGRIVSRHGMPTGIFIDNAMQLIRQHIPALSAKQVRQAILHGQTQCLQAGLTGVHDMGVGPEELSALKALDAEGQLKLRVYAAHDGTAPDLSPALAAGPIIPTAASEGRLTVRAVKFFADGALGSRGAALLEPYHDDPTNSGLLLMEPAVLEARVRTATQRGFQVATHAIGDRANMVTLDIYKRVFANSAWKHRPRVEHAQVLSQLDLQRFRAEGVIASMQPTHATSDMPWAEARVGPERIQGAYAWQSLLTSNATIAAGSDAPVEAISPILGLYAAITRSDAEGQPAGGWYVSEAMRPEQALAAFTTGAAWAGFSEAELGRLKEGYLADITVLSEDPMKASPGELIGAKVMLTIVQGELAYVRPGADAPPATRTATVTATATTP